MLTFVIYLQWMVRVLNYRGWVVRFTLFKIKACCPVDISEAGINRGAGHAKGYDGLFTIFLGYAGPETPFPECGHTAEQQRWCKLGWHRRILYRKLGLLQTRLLARYVHTLYLGTRHYY